MTAPRSWRRSTGSSPSAARRSDAGILEALSVIDTALDPSTTDYYTNPSAPPRPTPTPFPAGTYEAASIVLLSDGENTVDPDPLDAAKAARDRGVRIDTIGVGTTDGATLEVEGFRVHTQLEAADLQAISKQTDGTYYAAADQDDLGAIYDDVDRRLVIRGEPLELTSVFAAIGFGFLLVGGLLSLRWFGRLP